MNAPAAVRLLPIVAATDEPTFLIEAMRRFCPGTGLEFAVPEAEAHLIVALAPEGNGADAARRLAQTLRERMARYALPALVIPRQATPGATDEELSILLADDLERNTSGTVRATEQLVSLLGARVELMHLHVRKAVRGGAREAKAILERLEQRGKRLRALVEQLGGVYLPELWEGRVREELTRAADTSRRQVCVFGPHRAVHLKPLALGSMPYEAMLKMNGAVLFTM